MNGQKNNTNLLAQREKARKERKSKEKRTVTANISVTNGRLFKGASYAAIHQLQKFHTLQNGVCVCVCGYVLLCFQKALNII